MGDPRDGSETHLPEQLDDVVGFDIFRKVGRAEWDTLLFFYGVILSVGALATMGCLVLTSELMYARLGPTGANILVGFLSALCGQHPGDVRGAHHEPRHVPGAVAAGDPDRRRRRQHAVRGLRRRVALMGQARGKYTFFGHLKWAPAIALGYFAGVYTHLWLNAARF